MKNLFKKKIGAYEVAVLISMTVSDEISYIEKHVENYCKKESRLLKHKAKMLDEAQWLADACGIAILAVQYPDIVPDVIKQLMKVYISIDEHNGGGTMFSSDKMEDVFQSLLGYLQEFLKGVDEGGGKDSFARGQVYLCDVYNLKIFGGYPKPGSVIDNYTRELSDHFFILFDKKLSTFKIKNS
ncbi:hypothetical protein KC992_02100 [Candidatus Saccharibacteria bacterium]|nr:hypothetical protein [Candidatus Saccharibacteria bacterium]